MKKSLLTLSALLLAGISFSQVVLSENFEGVTAPSIPGTWTQSTSATDGGYLSGTASTLSSSYWPIATSNTTKILATNDDDCNCDKSADRLISPSMDLSAISAAALTVDVFFVAGQYNSLTETAKIEISTNGGTTWTTLQTLSAASDWQSLGVNLTPYVGNSNVKISFLYNDQGEWMYGLAIDNFKVSVPNANDAKLNTTSLVRYALVNTNSVLSANVTNVGSTAITSLTVDWNDGTSHSQVISVNIAPFASVDINHPTAVNYATALEKDITVTITAVNGGTDDDMANNSLASFPFNSVSQLAQKSVVIEEGTGTWCGWCPRGAVAMEYMDNLYPNDFIGIAVHNSDPMTVTEYDNGANFSGFPGCNVDRVLLDQSVSNALFESYYQDRVSLVVPAAINAVSSGTGTAVTVDVTTTFYTPFAAANYRLGVIISEDNVTGTASGYAQTNYYSSSSQNLALTGAGHDWQTEANPVPAASMEYDHVGRALLGGYSGQLSSVPAAITDGQAVNYSFSYTVPSTSNRANMHATAVLIDQTTGEIVNAKQISIAELGIAEAQTIGMEVYPNPATGTVNVKFEAKGGNYSVVVTDLAGRQVATTAVANATGVQVVALPIDGLSAGNYLVTIANNGASYTQNLVVK